MRRLKPGWKIVKFGDVVKNVNLVERDPKAKGIERVVGLEHIDLDIIHSKIYAGADAFRETTGLSAKSGLC